MSEFFHYAAVLCVAWSIFCRARKMDGPRVPPVPKFQNGAALVLAVASLPVFRLGEWSAGLLALALCVYLLIEAPRWSCEVPDGRT